MRTKRIRKIISTVVISLIFILFCAYGIVMSMMYSNLQKSYNEMTLQCKNIEEKIATCEKERVQLLTERDDCSNKLTQTETQLQKTVAELSSLKKN